MANNPIHCPSSSSSSAPTDLKLIERNRRNEMNSLLSTLDSLLPAARRETETAPDKVESATEYIKELQRKVEKLKEKKEKLMEEMRSAEIGKKPTSLMAVQVEVHHQVGSSSMEILLTTGSDYHFVFAQIVRLLQQNGAQVIGVDQSMFPDRVFHKILAQVIGEEMGPGSTDIGERICEKVKKFVSEYKTNNKLFI